MKYSLSTLAVSLLLPGFFYSLRAQAPNTWSKKADFGGNLPRTSAAGFSLNGIGYIGTGTDLDPIVESAYKKDFWAYDPVGNSWTQKADFGGTARIGAVGFSLDGKGYIGTGYLENGRAKDLWAYDPVDNSWTRKTDFPGTARSGAVGFSLDGKGYIGTGRDTQSGYTKDFWAYDPVGNSWSRKADFGGTARRQAVGFSLDSKGYIGTGEVSSGNTKDFWAYDPVGNSWSRKEDFGGTARISAVGFSLDGQGYIGTGEDASGGTRDFWAYDPAGNSWSRKADLSGPTRWNAVGFNLDGQGYIGTGQNANSRTKDFWAYNLSCNLSATITPGTAQIGCSGAALSLSGSSTGGTSPTYTWSSNPTGFSSNQQNPSFTIPTVTVATPYTLTLTVTEVGCTTTATTTVTVNPLPTASVSGGGSVCDGAPLPDVFIALTGSAPWSVTYSNSNTGSTTVNNISSSPYVISNAPQGTYTVTALSDAHCAGTAQGSAVVRVKPLPQVSISGTAAFCVGSSTTLMASPLNQQGVSYCWKNAEATPVWQTVGSAGFSAGGASISNLAIVGGIPYAGYLDQANGSKTTMMKFNGSTWDNVGSPGFSAVSANWISISFSGSTPYVVYQEWGNEFKATVMKFNGSTWDNVGSPGFSAGLAVYPNLAISEGIPYVAYEDYGNSAKATVMRFNGSTWENVGNVGFSKGQPNYINMAFSGSTPYVAYIDWGNEFKATVMKLNGSTWENVGDAFSSPYAQYPSLVISEGIPYVAYKDASQGGKATVKRFKDGTWETVGNAGFSANQVALLPSLVFSGGTPYIAYQDGVGGKTTVMRFKDGIWETVGSPGFSAGEAEIPRLAFSSSIPYVSYTDKANGEKATVMKFDTPCLGTDNSLSVNAVGTYILESTLEGCTASATQAVTVNPLPTASVSGGGIVCAGATLPNVSIALTGSAPWSVTYSNGMSSTPITNITTSPYVIANAPAGTYTVTALNDAHCTGTAQGSAGVTVTPKPADVVTTVTICSGASYVWAANSQTYTTTQTGLTIINDGCTANQVLNLTVTPKPNPVITNATICPGASYVWAANSQTYTTTQTGLTITNDGCTANQVLNLTVTTKPDPVITNATICSGTGYVWAANGQTYITTQTGLTITNDGCNANQILNLTVTPAPTAAIAYLGSPFCATSDAVSVTRTGTATGNYSVSPSGLTLNTQTGQITPSSSTPGNYTVTYTIAAAGGCGVFTTTTTVVIHNKPTFTLSGLGQTFQEGNTQILCDTDANPVNNLQLTVAGSCIVGSPVWRVQIGSGAWSNWSNQAPVNQYSDNQIYRYQAACNTNCPASFSGIITLTINYRASTPQNVSLMADGTSLAAGESKTICNLEGNTLAFSAVCAAGELLLYSVDGTDYTAIVPSQIVDNTFHNYRVRCRKADGTVSCVETESGVMSLKITTSGPAPVVNIAPLSGCGTSTAFSGTSTCGNLSTVWYNATTNQALPNLPPTTPTATTSYYARCQNTASAGEAGCLSEPSNSVTFTILPVNDPPVITASSDIVCTGTQVTISANCPAGSTAFWNTGVTTNSFQVAFSNVTKQTYWAKCIFSSGCQSSESSHKTVFWKAFELTLINIGQSQSATKPANDRNLWASQFITKDAGPVLENSTQANPTLYYTERANKGGPRYWTIQVETCALGTDGSVTYDLLAAPEAGVTQSFNTHENNAPYFMYANREGFTELYAQNHPAYGFYQSNDNGGNVYDSGLPKGLYKLSIRYWDQKGQGSIYPSTRQPAGNVLAYQEYWFRIQSQNGIGTGATRLATDLDPSHRRTAGMPNTFAQVAPNPVSNTLRLNVNESKGQKVNISLVDASGRALLQRAFVPETNRHQEEFGVSDLANGMYFLRVNTAQKQVTIKVVKSQ